MVKNRYLLFFGLVILHLMVISKVYAQPNSSIELKKPAKFDGRQLPAEKTGEGKLGKAKRIYQNTVSHYNYFFNAQQKLTDILDKAKSEFQEDYTSVLPFYNYQMSAVAKNTIQLDSVLYKCTAGILLHDLRSDWVDDLYLLMGQAYLYKKYYDSAAQVFQYINYAFSPKDGGYDIPIGSNASNTKGTFSIATKESSGFLKKMTATPPRRNESFLWRIRTYLEQNQTSEAGALIQILQIDPNFPKRLEPQLHEMTAYKFYKENQADSAAWHLSRALTQAVNAREKARWQFLIGQLYAASKKDSLAVAFYKQALKTTIDPVLEVYARLAISSIESAGKKDAIQQNLEELKKMAKRPLYEEYRDIIYYAAAKLEMEQHHTDNAQAYLLKSIESNSNNPSQREESFLLLADMNYELKKYPDAYRFYDSLTADQLKPNDRLRVIYRKPFLKTVAENMAGIQREDSLQRIALMPEEERNAFLKTKLKQLRKAAGLKDQESNSLSFGGGLALGTVSNTDLFSNVGSTSEFYFLNAGLMAKGVSEFKAKWGNRPNVDNWRRQSAVERSFASNIPAASISPTNDNNAKIKAGADKEITMESLKADLPMTTERMSASYLTMLKALMSNGNIFLNYLYDYKTGIDVYSAVANRYPDISETEQALYFLSLCYDHDEQPVQADSVRKILKENFSKGIYAKSLDQKTVPVKKDPATATYTKIYDLFLAGSFKEALEAKQQADKIYGNSFWTPQQLYIEAIYHVKNHADSLCLYNLYQLVKLFPKNPMADKAYTMIDVLLRRKEIETYLTELTIAPQPEEPVARPIDLDISTPVTTSVPFNAGETIKQTPKDIKTPEKISMPKPVIITNNGYAFNPTDSQYVALILTNVDPIFINEAKNAFNRYNRDYNNALKLQLTTISISAKEQLILFGPFINAGDAVGYIGKTRPVSATRIIPWLAADKYSFSIISNPNLAILKTQKDIAAYKAFLHGILPDQF